MAEKNRQTAEKLKHFREACGYSHRQVAEALNIDRSTYTKYERGDTEPSLTTLVRLAAIFGVAPAELLPGPIDESSEQWNVREDPKTGNPLFTLDKLERRLLAKFRVLDTDGKLKAIDLIGKIPKKD